MICSFKTYFMYSMVIHDSEELLHMHLNTHYTHDHTYTHTCRTCITHIHTYYTNLPHYNSKQCTVSIVRTHTCSPTAHHHGYQHLVHLHSVHLYMLLVVYFIDHVPPNPQGSRTPLMLAAREGHLPVARLLVEIYHCDVNEEDGKVSGWELIVPTCDQVTQEAGTQDA